MVWLKQDEFDGLVIRLGEFHLTMSYMGVIGKRFWDCGMPELMLESELVALRSVNGVFNGHHYNRALRSHKILYEALNRLRFGTFLESLSTEDEEKTKQLIYRLHESFPSPLFEQLLATPEMTDIVNGYCQFISENSAKCLTFHFFSSYCCMVELLLDTIRATKLGDWDLHLACVKAMLPWFFSYDHQNYARYGTAYLLEIEDLPSTNPSVTVMINNGNFWVEVICAIILWNMMIIECLRRSVISDAIKHQIFIQIVDTLPISRINLELKWSSLKYFNFWNYKWNYRIKLALHYHLICCD